MIITVEVTPSDADESSEVKVREINAHLKGQGSVIERGKRGKGEEKEKGKKEKKENGGEKSVYVIHEPINQRWFSIVSPSKNCACFIRYVYAIIPCLLGGSLIILADVWLLRTIDA